MEKRKRLISSKFYITFVAFLFSFHHNIYALTIFVQDVECIQENVLDQGDTIFGSFVVDHKVGSWTSKQNRIDFTVYSREGNVIYSLKETYGRKFELKAPKAGIYKFCFHSPRSTMEIVSFHIHVGHIPKEIDGLAKDEHADHITARIFYLSEALENVTAEQKYLKACDVRHLHTTESTRKHVIFCTIAEYLAIVCASGLQVTYVRRLFRKSVAYNAI